MSIFDPYEYRKGTYDDNADRNKIVEEAVKDLLSSFGIDVSNYNLGQIEFKDTYIDPSKVTGNTSPVMVAWQGQLWIKPPNSQAYPITQSANGLIQKINTVLPDPQTGILLIKSKDGTVKVTDDISAFTIDISIDDAINKINKNAADILKKLEKVESSSNEIIASKSGVTTTLKFVPTSAASNLVSTDPQNWLHIGTDGKLAVTSAKKGKVIEKINNVDPDISNNFEIKNTDDKIDIASGNAAITLNINDNKIVDGIISTDTHNSVLKGVDGKLFVEKSIKSINGMEGDDKLRNINLISSDNSVTFSNKPNNEIDCKAVTGGGTINSLNGITQANIELVAGSNITISKQGVAGSESLKIDSTGSGGTSNNEDYSFNDAIYLAETVGNAPSGSYDKPYEFNRDLQVALDAIGSGGKTSILPVNSNVPVSPTDPSTIIKIEHKELRSMDVPTGSIKGGIDIDLSADTKAAYHDISINLKDLSRKSGTVITYAPINSSTSLDNESFIKIRVDQMYTNDNLEIFKLDSSKVVSSATKKLYVNIEIDNLICPSSSTTPNRPIIDLKRGTITGLNSIIVNIVIGNANLNSTPPSIDLHKLVEGKGNGDSVSLNMYGNGYSSNILKHVDLALADSIVVSGGVVKHNIIIAGENFTLPQFSTDAEASKIVFKSGSLYYNTQTNKVKKYDGAHWVSLTGASVADNPIPDSIYYDDNSGSTATPDGTLEKPYKLLAKAIEIASAKSGVDNRVCTVRAKDGASIVNSETLVFGGDGKHLSVNLNIPYIILKGSIEIDLRSKVDHNLNTVYINVHKLDKVQIKTTNPIAIPKGDTGELGVYIDVAANEKIVKSDKESFLCDVSSLTTPDTKLKKRFVTYIEKIEKIVEIYDPTTQVNSIVFKLSDELRDSLFRAECQIRGINEYKDVNNKPISRVNYISFTSPLSTQSVHIHESVRRMVLITDIGTNGTVYDYLASNGESEESYMTSSKIKSSSIEADTFKTDTEVVGSSTVNKTFIPPNTASGVINEPYSIAVDKTIDKVYYVNSKHKKIFLGGVSNTSKMNVSRFEAFGDIRSNFVDKEITFPHMHVECIKDDGTPEGHVIDIPSTSLNLRFEDIVKGSNTLAKQENMSQVDYKNKNYYGVLFMKLSDITKSGTTDIFTDSSTATEVETTITFEMPKPELHSNIIVGNTITIKNSRSDHCVEAIVKSKTVTGNKIVLKTYSNLGHGDKLAASDFKPLTDVADANHRNLNEIYMGDRFGFDFSKGLLDPATDNREYCVPLYYPVLFQDEGVPTRNAIVLIGHNARFGEPLDDTPGKRTFCKKHIPPAMINLKTVWGAKNIAYQHLSIGINAGIVNNKLLNTDNGYRQIPEFYCSFDGPHWEMKYVYGGNNTSKIYMFNPKQMYGDKGIWITTAPTKDEFVGGGVYLSSSMQDDASISLVRFAVTILNANIKKNLKIANTLNGNITIDTEFGLSATDIRASTLLGLGDTSSLPKLTLHNINLKADKHLEVILAYRKGYVMIRSELESIVKFGEPALVIAPISVSDFSDLSSVQTHDNKNIVMLP